MSIPRENSILEKYEWNMLMHQREYLFIKACKRTNAELEKCIERSLYIISFCEEKNDFFGAFKEGIYLAIFEEVLKRRGKSIVTESLEPYFTDLF